MMIVKQMYIYLVLKVFFFLLFVFIIDNKCLAQLLSQKQTELDNKNSVIKHVEENKYCLLNLMITNFERNIISSYQSTYNKNIPEQEFYLALDSMPIEFIDGSNFRDFIKYHINEKNVNEYRIELTYFDKQGKKIIKSKTDYYNAIDSFIQKQRSFHDDLFFHLQYSIECLITSAHASTIENQRFLNPNQLFLLPNSIDDVLKIYGLKLKKGNSFESIGIKIIFNTYNQYLQKYANKLVVWHDVDKKVIRSYYLPESFEELAVVSNE